MNLTREQIETCLHFVSGEEERGVYVPKYMLTALCEMALREADAEAIVKELVRIHDLAECSDVKRAPTYEELDAALSSARALVKGKA